MEPHKTFKVVLLGDAHVGKTSVALRYTQNTFSEKHHMTQQAGFFEKSLVVAGQRVSLTIWDTAGQERFHALGPIYYRGSQDSESLNRLTDFFSRSSKPPASQQQPIVPSVIPQQHTKTTAQQHQNHNAPLPQHPLQQPAQVNPSQQVLPQPSPQPQPLPNGTISKPAGQSKPSTPYEILNASIQNHFNCLTVAFRNNLLERSVLITHLTTLFGTTRAETFMTTIDGIDQSKIIPFPANADINTMLGRTQILLQMQQQLQQQQKQQHEAAQAAAAQSIAAQAQLAAHATAAAQAAQAQQLAAAQQQKIQDPDTKQNTPQQQQPPTPQQQQLPTPPQHQPLPTPPQPQTVQPLRQLSITPTSQPQQLPPPPIVKETSPPEKAPTTSKKEHHKKEKKENTKKEPVKKEKKEITKKPPPEKKRKAAAEPEAKKGAVVEPPPPPTPPPAVAAEEPKEDDNQSIEQLNDVTCIANIDMSNESEQFLPEAAESVTYAPEIEHLFLNSGPLRKKLCSIEKRERDEKARKDHEENERILKEAKIQEAALRKRQDDKTIALREKFSKARAEDEERLRTLAANSTALAAVGNIGKKKAVQPMLGRLGSLSAQAAAAASAPTAPPVPNATLVSLQTMAKDGVTMTPEQTAQLQQLTTAFDLQVKQYQDHQKKDNIAPTPTTPATGAPSTPITNHNPSTPITSTKTPSTPSDTSHSESTGDNHPGTPATTESSTTSELPTPTTITPRIPIVTTTTPTAPPTLSNFLPPSSLETVKSRHLNRKISIKDCFFASNYIGSHIIQKYDLKRLRKRSNTTNMSLII
eukprot:gene7864-9231_t